MVYKKKPSFEQKMIKLWNEWNFVENKTETLQHVFQIQYISIIIIQLTRSQATCWPVLVSHI